MEQRRSEIVFFKETSASPKDLVRLIRERPLEMIESFLLGDWLLELTRLVDEPLSLGEHNSLDAKNSAFGVDLFSSSVYISLISCECVSTILINRPLGGGMNSALLVMFLRC